MPFCTTMANWICSGCGGGSPALIVYTGSMLKCPWCDTKADVSTAANVRKLKEQGYLVE
jgi:hypothetical protein